MSSFRPSGINDICGHSQGEFACASSCRGSIHLGTSLERDQDLADSGKPGWDNSVP